MSEYNYDSYCGLYCGACSILKAERDGSRDPFAAFWADDRQMALHCRGCKSDSLFENCAICDIRTCAISKGVERCLECGDFPCEKMNPEMMAGLVQKLPHLSSATENVEKIMTQGCANWLAQQAELWSCPECQTAFSWYDDSCSKCGTDLTKRKGFSGQFDPSIFDLFKKE